MSHFEMILKELGNKRVFLLYPGLVLIEDEGKHVIQLFVGQK